MIRDKLKGVWLVEPKYRNTCLYCAASSEEAEHVMPLSVVKELDSLGVMQYEYLVPSCVRCNRIATDYVFSTLGERVDYIHAELRRRGVWPIPQIPERLRSVDIVGRGLLSKVDDPTSSSVERSVDLLFGLIKESPRLRRVQERQHSRQRKSKPSGMTSQSYSKSTEQLPKKFYRLTCKQCDLPFVYRGNFCSVDCRKRYNAIQSKRRSEKSG